MGLKYPTDPAVEGTQSELGSSIFGGDLNTGDGSSTPAVLWRSHMGLTCVRAFFALANTACELSGASSSSASKWSSGSRGAHLLEREGAVEQGAAVVGRIPCVLRGVHPVGRL